MIVENKRDVTPGSAQDVVKADQIVSFKGHFLDQLIDAVALIEVVEIIIRHHEDVYLRKSGFVGLAMLIEQIKELLDVNANLLTDDVVIPSNTVMKKTGGADSAG